MVRIPTACSAPAQMGLWSALSPASCPSASNMDPPYMQECEGRIEASVNLFAGHPGVPDARGDAPDVLHRVRRGGGPGRLLHHQRHQLAAGQCDVGRQVAAAVGGARAPGELPPASCYLRAPSCCQCLLPAPAMACCAAAAAGLRSMHSVQLLMRCCPLHGRSTPCYQRAKLHTCW